MLFTHNGCWVVSRHGILSSSRMDRIEAFIDDPNIDVTLTPRRASITGDGLNHMQAPVKTFNVKHSTLNPSLDSQLAECGG
jgi:hypothetical protein